MTRGDILLRVAASFAEAGIRWCILHGYQEFPQRVLSDVDIIVAKQDQAQVSRLLLQLPGIHLVQAINYQPDSVYYVLCSLDATPIMLQLDVSANFQTAGHRWLMGEEFLAARCQFHNLLWAPPPALEFIAYLIKKITKAWQLGNNNFQDLHAEYLTRLFLNDEQACTLQLSRFFSAQDFIILCMAAKTGSWQVVIEKSPEIARRLLARKKAYTDGVYWHGRLQEIKRWVARCRSPTGIVVAVLGPDGAGKTAVIKHVKALLAPAFRRTSCMHLRPHFGARGRYAASTSNPHGQLPRNAVASSFKLGWWLLDYTAGYIASVYWRKVRSTLVVFDRYFYDLFVDPVRYRFAGPWPVAKWLARFVPPPEIIIILDAPEHVLLQRKNEVRENELARQRRAYLILAHQHAQAHVVDATQSINDIAAHVSNIVLQYLAQRQTRRLELGEFR